MKRLLYILSIFASVAAVTACVDDNGRTEVFEIAEESTALPVEKEGGIVSVIVRSTLDYTVEIEKNWCSIAEKKATGFRLNVTENETIVARQNTVTLRAHGFEPITLTIDQEAGELFFTIADDQKTKTFDQGGGTQTVEIRTNIDTYEVISSETWCGISDKTTSGFKITLGTNDGFRRSASLTVTAPGMPPVNVEVSQSGNPLLSNTTFTAGLNNWTTIGTEGMFELNSWMPGGLSGNSVTLAGSMWDWTIEGSLVQKIVGIPDGTYTLSARVAGGGTTGELALIAIDKDGVETKTVISDEWGDWSVRSTTIEVSGGECSVGLYVSRSATPDRLWFNATDIKLE